MFGGTLSLLRAKFGTNECLVRAKIDQIYSRRFEYYKFMIFLPFFLEQKTLLDNFSPVSI